MAQNILYSNVNYTRMKGEDEINEQAVRLMAQATKRNKYEALLNPETPREQLIARAYNNELAAHYAYCKAHNLSKKSGSFLVNRVMQKDWFYQTDGSDGYYLISVFVSNRGEIDPPFGNCMYLPYSEHNNELMKHYIMGIRMGLTCKYKHPHVEICWRRRGIEKPIWQVD